MSAIEKVRERYDHLSRAARVTIKAGGAAVGLWLAANTMVFIAHTVPQETGVDDFLEAGETSVMAIGGLGVLACAVWPRGRGEYGAQNDMAEDNSPYTWKVDEQEVEILRQIAEDSGETYRPDEK